MTFNQAVKKAKALVGTNAVCQQYKNGFCTFGILFMGMAIMVKGSGKTWEAAFEDYERRQRGGEGQG